MKRPRVERSDLLEDLFEATARVASAYIECHGAPPEALEVARCCVGLGPVKLVFDCRPDTLRRLYHALRQIRNQRAIPDVPTAESLARVAVSLEPVEAIAWSEGIQGGPLAGIPSRPGLEDEPPEFGVQIRREDAAEAERRLAWLMLQVGFPAATADREAA